MEVKAKVKYVRVAPRKARLVVDVIRGLDVKQALDQLAFINKKGVKPIVKLINSVVANATNNFSLDKNNLFIKEIRVDEGPIYYRWLPRAHGRATPKRKKTSHIEVLLDERKPTKKVIPAKKEPAKVTTTIAPDELKEEIKPTKVKLEDEKIDSDATIAKTIEPVDITRKGKHRQVQHQDRKALKSKGFFNKIFRRKTGE